MPETDENGIPDLRWMDGRRSAFENFLMLLFFCFSSSSFLPFIPISLLGTIAVSRLIRKTVKRELKRRDESSSVLCSRADVVQWCGCVVAFLSKFWRERRASELNERIGKNFERTMKVKIKFYSITFPWGPFGDRVTGFSGFSFQGKVFVGIVDREL